jgi:hypothetical protein
VFPVANAGAELPGLHQHGEIPGNDLSDHADGFMPGVAEVVAVDGDGLAVNLVGPSREITVATHRLRDVHGLSPRKRFAVVQRFEGSDHPDTLRTRAGLATMLLDGLVQSPAAS